MLPGVAQIMGEWAAVRRLSGEFILPSCSAAEALFEYFNVSHEDVSYSAFAWQNVKGKKTVPAIGRVGRPVGILVDKRTSIDGIGAFGCSHRAYEKKRWPRHAEPCPKCGIYIQRDFEASGCPEVSISGM